MRELKFDANLGFQLEAISAITDIFKGQKVCRSNFSVRKQNVEDSFKLKGETIPDQNDNDNKEESKPDVVAYMLMLSSEEILENVHAIQLKNGLEQSPADVVKTMNFSIWMETGTGKTYVYLRTVFELNKLYHGPGVNPDDDIRYEWARIPHFHYDFYVYKYATGISAALALSKKILDGETEGYLRFLKAGDSKEVIDIMKDAGVDFTTPAPVQDAMDVFAEQVKELKKCLK